MKMETLRLREFKRLVQDQPRVVSTNGKMAHFSALSPDSLAAARELPLKQQHLWSTSQQPGAFPTSCPRHGRVTLHDLQIASATSPPSICAYTHMHKYTRSGAFLKSQTGHSTRWATHGPPLWEFNQLIQKQIFEVYQTETK